MTLSISCCTRLTPRGSPPKLTDAESRPFTLPQAARTVGRRSSAAAMMPTSPPPSSPIPLPPPASAADCMNLRDSCGDVNRTLMKAAWSSVARWMWKPSGGSTAAVLAAAAASALRRRGPLPAMLGPPIAFSDSLNLLASAAIASAGTATSASARESPGSAALWAVPLPELRSECECPVGGGPVPFELPSTSLEALLGTATVVLSAAVALLSLPVGVDLQPRSVRRMPAVVSAAASVTPERGNAASLLMTCSNASAASCGARTQQRDGCRLLKHRRYERRGTRRAPEEPDVGNHEKGLSWGRVTRCVPFLEGRITTSQHCRTFYGQELRTAS